MEKLYMQWQYDPQKAQLEHKGQICAKFHKCKYNSFRIVVWKRKLSCCGSLKGKMNIFDIYYSAR